MRSAVKVFLTTLLFVSPVAVDAKDNQEDGQAARLIAETVAPPFEPCLFSSYRFLQPETEEKLVTLTQKDRAVLVRIYSSALFDSGSAEIKPALNDVLRRIGAAIAEHKFKALVIGHTDNVPIHTLQYPTNWHLSEARAKAVAAMLSDLTGPGAITSESRADTEPIGDNATPEGREANRRIEILVYGAADRAGLEPPEQSPKETTP